MTRRARIVLGSVGILLGSCVLSNVIRALAAREETVPQTLEVLSRHELGPNRFLVRLAPARADSQPLSVESVTRYPFDLAVVTAGGTGKAPRPAARAVPVRTAVMTPGPVQRRVVAFGTVEAARDARVPFEVPGVVRRLRFVLGEPVAEGAPLVELDARVVSERLAQEGQWVAAGAAALRLRGAEADLLRAEVAAARATVGVAHVDSQRQTARAALDVRARDLERWTSLAARDLASRDRADQADTQWRAALMDVQRVEAAFDEARAAEREAQAALELARAARDQGQLDLERCVVRAPFAGVVSERLAQEGQWVAAGAAALRLVGTERLRVRVHVREEDAVTLRTGARAQVFLPGIAGLGSYDEADAGGAPEQARAGRARSTEAGSTYDEASREAGERLRRTHHTVDQGAGPFEAKVEGVAAAAEPRDRTFAVDVAIDAPGSLLRAGMFARVVLDAGTLPLAVLLPDGAVVAEGGAYHVFVAEGDRVRRVAVTLGPRQGEARLLRGGLEAACEVVVDGTGLLFDGAPIARLGE